MKYLWYDYQPQEMDDIETWLDEPAVKSTGLDEGFFAFYDYWAKQEGFVVGENFWCKVVYQGEEPLAVIALCEYEGTLNIMEMVVHPQKRGYGIGTELLKELLDNKGILGFDVCRSEAVIFPDNDASQKAFQKAGFRHYRTHEDGTALYYAYVKAIQ